jgi:hypothetical protein
LKIEVIKGDQVTIKASVHEVDKKAEAAAQAKASAKQKNQYLLCDFREEMERNREEER